MILNDFYYVFIALTFISMIVFFVCFVRFVYKDLGGVKVGKDAFLFFDYMFFGSGWKSNLPVLAFILTLVFGNCFDYIKDHDSNTIQISMIGFLAMTMFFIHCRFFSKLSFDAQKIKFIKEFALNFKVNSRYVFLWGSRLLYLALAVSIYQS